MHSNYRQRGDSFKQNLIEMPNLQTNSTTHKYPPMIASQFRIKHTNSNENCLNLLPYSSISAFLLCLFGLILFTTMMLWAFNATIEMVRRTTFIDDLPWLDKIQLMFIISAVIMLIISFSFLIIGILSTGSTREKLFRQEKARRGGRIFCVMAICLASALCLLWILILAFSAILCFIFTLFSTICSKMDQSLKGNSCLNLNFIRPILSEQTYQKASLEFCNGQLQQFCAISNTVMLWYCMGFFGSLIICFGLVQFILTNAVNFTQIGNEAKNSELFRILHTELISNEKVTTDDSTQFCNPSAKNNIHYLHKSNNKLFHQTKSPRANNNDLSFDAYRRHSYQKSLRNSFIDEMNAKN